MTTKEFNALPKRDRKILISKDVIKRLKSKFYKTRDGSFYLETSLKGDLDVKKNFARLKGCVVCDLGAVALSITRICNVLTIDDIANTTPESKQMIEKVFTKEELIKMEIAFECGGRGTYAVQGYSLFSYDQRTKCRDFGEQYKNPTQRAIAIHQNMINYGTLDFSSGVMVGFMA